MLTLSGNILKAISENLVFNLYIWQLNKFFFNLVGIVGDCYFLDSKNLVFLLVKVKYITINR